MKRYRNTIIYIVIGGLLVFAWFKLVDIPILLSSFENLRIPLLVAAAAFYVMAWLFRALRWGVIVRPIVKLNAPFTFSLSMASVLINYLLSFRAGDLAQCIMSKKSKNVTISASLSTVYIDRLINLSPLYQCCWLSH